MPLANVPEHNVEDVESNKNQDQRDPALDLSSDQNQEEYRKNQDDISPPAAQPGTTEDLSLKGKATNMLFHRMPAVNFANQFIILECYTGIFCSAIAIVIVAPTALFRNFGLISSIVIILFLGVSVWLWMGKIKEEAEKSRRHAERMRGETVRLNLLPESVE